MIFYSHISNIYSHISNYSHISLLKFLLFAMIALGQSFYLTLCYYTYIHLKTKQVRGIVKNSIFYIKIQRLTINLNLFEIFRTSSQL